MSETLLAWLGKTDLDAAAGNPDAGIGPIARVVKERTLKRAVLLVNYPEEDATAYRTWLSARTRTPIQLRFCALDNPIDYAAIYHLAVAEVDEVTRGSSGRLVFHLSPGTPAMAAIWIVLAKTRYRDRAALIQTSRERGVQDVAFPFDLYAELVPELLRRSDDELVRLNQGLPPAAPEFENIVHRCEAMQRAIALARRLALRDLPVLLEGESGTGKELFARAIHRASARHANPFLPINCGAIPPELVDSELFGHKKGAFTGADSHHTGVFEEASGGTLFLDEIGELPKPAQVRLLRALQERKIRRVGETRERSIDVRIVAATHRDLLAEVAADRFREDLFHRVAVGILHLPPLRHRGSDLSLLIDHLLAEISEEVRQSQPGREEKKISSGARFFLSEHPWPGNVRELRNTLLRASVFAESEHIHEEDVRRALLRRPVSEGEDVMRRPLGAGFDLSALLDEVKCVYLRRALDRSGGKKTEAARLLGLPHYQTVSQWMDKLGIES